MIYTNLCQKGSENVLKKMFETADIVLIMV